jgi:hypothetical protein
MNLSRMAGNRSTAMPTPVSWTITDSPSDASIVSRISPVPGEFDHVGRGTETSRLWIPHLASGSTVSDNVPDERRLSDLLSIRRLGLVTEN